MYSVRVDVIGSFGSSRQFLYKNLVIYLSYVDIGFIGFSMGLCLTRSFVTRWRNRVIDVLQENSVKLDLLYRCAG